MANFITESKLKHDLVTGPSLVSFLVSLINEIVGHCKTHNFELKSISAFDITTDIWP